MSDAGETEPTDRRSAAAGTRLAVATPSIRNLTDIVERNAVETPDKPIYARRIGNDWVDVTCTEFRHEVTQLAKGLVAAGIKPGDRIALIARTRYEWTLFDFAIWYAGAVTVPIYPTASPAQIEHALFDSQAVAAVTETETLATLVRDIWAARPAPSPTSDAETDAAAHPPADATGAGNNVADPAVRHIWTIDKGCVAELRAQAAVVPAEELNTRRAALTPDSLATIIYTSGTTGEPKGCMLTHGNFLFAVQADVDVLPELFGPDAATLLFLPLAHVLPRLVQIGCALTRTRVAHSPSVRTLLDDLQSFRPTFILAVPRVLENLFNSASQQAFADGRGGVFNLAATTAMDYSQSVHSRWRSPILMARHAVFDRMIYSKVRTMLGDRLQYAITGGAPLGTRLAHFFRGCGVTVIEGYGLTETTAATTVNRISANRIGTVGQAIPGAEVRIADDGEVLVRGPHVTRGYHQRPELTRRAFTDDGWLRTGDLGELDNDGFLTIIGRKEEIIVTSNGTKVAPTQLEERIESHPLVAQALVLGDDLPFVAALIALDRPATKKWAQGHGKSTRRRELVADPDLRAEIQRAVDAANEAVSHPESVRRFWLLPAAWTEESGYLTPLHKVRRPIVMRDFANEIARMYE